MPLTRFLFFLLILIATYICSFAQTAEEAAKAKQQQQDILVEQLAGEIPSLKLAENRAVVFARLGSIVWKDNQKRGTEMFQNAVNELIAAQQAAESEHGNPNAQNDLLFSQITRPMILNAIAASDAERALDALYKTRPAAIVRAIAFQAEKSNKIKSYDNGMNLPQNELNLEQSLIRLAAAQNPARAIELFEASLKKGISDQTLELLKTINNKDPEAASRLGSAVIRKISENKFVNDNPLNYQHLNFALTFLIYALQNRQNNDYLIKFNESEINSLAGKVISFYLEKENNAYPDERVVSIASKISPASVEQLKSQQKVNARRSFGGIFDAEVNNLINSEKSPEQLVAEAKNFSLNSRRLMYQAAANKLAGVGNFSGAEAILKDNFSEDGIEVVSNDVRMQYFYYLLNNKKFAEAEQFISEFPEGSQISLLINLAQNVFNQDQVENQGTATAILGKARMLIPENPETSAEMGILMQVISAYSNIEPTQSFNLLESLIPRFNELSDAAVVINAFQGNTSIKKGEILIAQGNYTGFYGVDFYVIQTLANKDFNRTESFINQFTRRETRIGLKLQLAEYLSH